MDVSCVPVEGPKPSTKMHVMNLRFLDARLEQDFNKYALPLELLQGRWAIAIGCIAYVSFGLLDFWFAPPDDRVTLTLWRVFFMGLAYSVMFCSYRPWFARFSPQLFALTGLSAGLGMLTVFSYLDPDVIAYYYPGLMMVAFFTYNFVGTRYIYALGVDLLLLALYNVLAFQWGYETHLLITHDFYLVTVNMIGGTLGYLTERNRRNLFLRERQLEHEKAFHKERSQHDDLTALFNRRAFFEQGNRMLSSTQRYEHPLSVLMMDVDHFKTINDTHGHGVGDQALKAVACAIQNSLRETDLVGRIGGEEFTAILPETSLAGAKKLAERIRQTVAEQHVEGAGAPVELRISIGVSEAHGDASLDTLLFESDKALMQAKAEGRNRVVCCEAIA
ncbi:GGDEF domain-containing protein [Pseudomonadota bacterium]